MIRTLADFCKPLGYGGAESDQSDSGAEDDDSDDPTGLIRIAKSLLSASQLVSLTLSALLCCSPFSFSIPFFNNLLQITGTFSSNMF